MMKRSRTHASLAAALIFCGLAASPSMSETTQAMPPFQAHVDMKTFMDHVLTPAANLIWKVNGSVIDASGEHDLGPKTDDDWENITSGAATLAEATNAMMIPGRALDPEWNAYVKKLADAADRAYQAAEAHDLKTVADVSDHLDGICAACHRHYGLE
jgi:hypothetical protein